MRNFIDIILLENMGRAEAEAVFARFGAFSAGKLGLDDLKAAYKKLAMANHPDRGGDDIKMSLINSAYEILKTPAPRVDPVPDPEPEVQQNSDRSYWDRHPGEQAHRAREAEKKRAASMWNIRKSA
jgi:hypothetical protein